MDAGDAGGDALAVDGVGAALAVGTVAMARATPATAARAIPRLDILLPHLLAAQRIRPAPTAMASQLGETAHGRATAPNIVDLPPLCASSGHTQGDRSQPVTEHAIGQPSDTGITPKRTINA